MVMITVSPILIWKSAMSSIVSTLVISVIHVIVTTGVSLIPVALIKVKFMVVEDYVALIIQVAARNRLFFFPLQDTIDKKF